MHIDQVTDFVTILGALSVASERLVEIIKGFVKPLGAERNDPVAEARRRGYLQILAVGAGIVTATLSQSILVENELLPFNVEGVFAACWLGLLISGGSGLWNGVLSYLQKVKDIRKVELESLRSR